MYELIIIGAGPAGLAAGLYAGRYRLNTLILEKINIGGQILSSPTIENFPGFPTGIATQELIERFKEQVDELGVNIEMEEVLELIAKSEDAVYGVKTKERTHQTKSIIIATGAQPKRLGVQGEERLIGRGVSYCGTCDGPLFIDKEIVVIGAGDRAVEEAIFLSGYAKKVTLVHRRNELRASGILQEKAKKNPKINFVLESVVEEIIGQNRVEGLKVENAKTQSWTTIACQGVFVFVGIKPNTDFLKNQLHLDELGFIITDPDLKTSCEGIFASGDCRKKSFYQVISACSEGATAADSAQKYLLKL